jgi:plasmid stabilization system protein ParE
MSRIKLSRAARADIERLYEFLAQFDLTVADNGNEAIIAALEYIQAHPHSGSPVPERPNLRKSVVAFGASGYLIFHKRYEKTDINLIARIIHQKEWYDAQAISFTRE